MECSCISLLNRIINAGSYMSSIITKVASFFKPQEMSSEQKEIKDLEQKLKAIEKTIHTVESTIYSNLSRIDSLNENCESLYSDQKSGPAVDLKKRCSQLEEKNKNLSEWLSKARGDYREQSLKLLDKVPEEEKISRLEKEIKNLNNEISITKRKIGFNLEKIEELKIKRSWDRIISEEYLKEQTSVLSKRNEALNENILKLQEIISDKSAELYRLQCPGGLNCAEDDLER